MQLFVWDHHFSTGLPELDEQHKALIDVFNRLHDTLFHAGAYDINATKTAIGIMHLLFDSFFIVLNRSLIVLLNLPHAFFMHDTHIKNGVPITKTTTRALIIICATSN